MSKRMCSLFVCMHHRRGVLSRYMRNSKQHVPGWDPDACGDA